MPLTLATFTDEELARIRHHLGYPQNVMAAGIGLGVPTIYQALFPVEGALRQIRAEAADLVRVALARCDATEEDLYSAQRRLKAEGVGDIRLRSDECEARRREYLHWVGRLSQDTGAPINPMSWQGGGQGGNMNATRMAA